MNNTVPDPQQISFEGSVRTLQSFLDNTLMYENLGEWSFKVEDLNEQVETITKDAEILFHSLSTEKTLISTHDLMLKNKDGSFLGIIDNSLASQHDPNYEFIELSKYTISKGDTGTEMHIEYSIRIPKNYLRHLGENSYDHSAIAGDMFATLNPETDFYESKVQEDKLGELYISSKYLKILRTAVSDLLKYVHDHNLV